MMILTRHGSLVVIFWLVLLIARSVEAVQIVTTSPKVTCTREHLSGELTIYKDPTLFLPNLALIYADPIAGWESLLDENPMLTHVKGDVEWMLFEEDAREFKNFGAVAKLYEMVDPRFGHKHPSEGQSRRSVKILPIKMCGEMNAAYRDTLGFVIEDDLKLARKKDVPVGKLPPSVYPNPIPKLDALQENIKTPEGK